MYTKRGLMLLLLPLLLLLLMIMNFARGNQQMAGNGEKMLAGIQKRFISLEESDALPEPHTREQVELLRHLNFVPPAIDFGKWSVGQTVTQTVTLFNQHTNRTVHLNSVAGLSPVFYGSFFGTHEVPPQGNTTFSVVFLPRQLGAISTGVLINTSFGRAEIAVHVEGSECPYRLKPLVGIKAPINATLTPEIHMYNPHERPLQILEVYSSGGEFQLELPSGVPEGPQKLWEIPPHSLKPVIRISFHGRTAGNHSAYIRIKIAEQSAESAEPLSPLEHFNENFLVIPVEFEILPKHGAYARNPLADFGRLATDQHEDALHFKLNMENQSVDASQRKLIGNYLRDIPGLSYDPYNANIVLHPDMFEESASINDVLVLGEEKQQQFTVMIRADIFKGGLYFDRNVTLFITSMNNEETPLETRRSLVVRNNFAFPLMIYNVSLSEPIDSALLEISSLEHEFLLQPGDSMELLQLHLLDRQARFNSMLLIESNVTIFEIPLVACSGLLHVSTQKFSLQVPTDSDYGLDLDLGTVPIAENSRSGFIILRNDNPTPIRISNYKLKLATGVYYSSTFLGCVPAGVNATSPKDSLHNSTSYQFCKHIGQGESAVYMLTIKTYVAEESSGTIMFWTPYELIQVTVRFKSADSQMDIEHEQLQFKSCFPGKICTAVLSIRSSYLYPVRVKSIEFQSPGLRFKDFNAKGTKIAAMALTKVGRIYFEPSAVCRSNCYIRPTLNEHSIFPIANNGAGGAAGSGQANNNLLYDGVEVRQRAELYRQFKRQLYSMSLTLHTVGLPPLELDFSIAIEWPKLVQFQPLPPTPPIEVGQVQRQWITMSNPTTQPLLLDYFLSDPAFARRTQLSLPLEVIDGSGSNCYLTDQDVFSLPDAPFGGPVLFPPLATLTIPVQFSAKQADKYCTLLHVRSNLTLYEAVWLTARAVQSQFRFGNRRPGSSTPLLFELTRESFERCDGTVKAPGNLDEYEAISSSHNVVTTRSFTARNAGVLPIRVDGFLIGKRPCEGYGFKVLDCDGFELRENETRKIEISFSTDFTASRVQRTLTLLTNLSYDIQYQLLAQLPAESVERCAASLPRPPWESTLSNASVVVLLVVFCLVLLSAIFDGRAIVAQQNAYDAARYKSPLQPTFNLRNIVKMQMSEDAAAAASAAAATAAALKVEQTHHQQQQQKLRNGQIKDLRKRTTATSTVSAADKVLTSRKTKSWTSWGMGLTTQSTATAAAPPPKIQPACSPKPSKKLNSSSALGAPAPAAAPGALRAPKKTKPTTPVGVTPKSKLDSPPAEQQEKIKVSPSSKPNATPQANVSPKAVKASAETPKERVLKEQNGSVKKLGKTPGRERRKEQKMNATNGLAASKKSTERKQRNKQLNFNGGNCGMDNLSAVTAPLDGDVDADADTMITSPWETSSGVSFRDILQTKPMQDVDNGLKWNCGNSSSRQLGPIGSRKACPTQAVTSLWEPLMTPEATVTSNALMNSLFDISQPSSIGMNMNDLPVLNDLCNNLYTREQREHREQLLKQQLLMEYQRKQEQRLQQEKLLLMANMEQHAGSNWPMNHATPAATWTPLGYAGWPNQTAMRTSSPAHGINPGVGVIRPPPGLETSYNNQNCQLPAAVAGPTTSSATQTATTTGAISNGHNHIDSHNNAQQDAGEDRAQNVRTQYDLFTSPSSIWSDNWRQRNNHMN